MNADKITVIGLTFIAIVFVSSFLAMFYSEYEKNKCKLLGIDHNMPYLEIKELCE